MVKKKKGWLRMVEVFFAISIISAILVVVLDIEEVKKDSTSSRVYGSMKFILEDIEVNDTLREIILDSSPSAWDNINPIAKNHIISKTPGYLDCRASICLINSECDIGTNIDNEIYARSVGIFADSDDFNPKQLRLFCWVV